MRTQLYRSRECEGTVKYAKHTSRYHKTSVIYAGTATVEETVRRGKIVQGEPTVLESLLFFVRARVTFAPSLSPTGAMLSLSLSPRPFIGWSTHTRTSLSLHLTPLFSHSLSLSLHTYINKYVDTDISCMYIYLYVNIDIYEPGTAKIKIGRAHV